MTNKTQEEIEEKRLQIDSIRRREIEITTDLFKRGQLAGAQQALWWVLGLAMDPVKAILSDAEIALLKDVELEPSLEPLGPLVEAEGDDLPLCNCGMGDASMPELHADDCAINLALSASEMHT